MVAPNGPGRDRETSLHAAVKEHWSNRAHGQGLGAPRRAAAVPPSSSAPSETVLNILPDPQGSAFRKESGEPVIDGLGRRVDRGALDRGHVERDRDAPHLLRRGVSNGPLGF